VAEVVLVPAALVLGGVVDVVLDAVGVVGAAELRVVVAGAVVAEAVDDDDAAELDVDVEARFQPCRSSSRTVAAGDDAD
jgi:hypothetical protein